MEQQTFTIPPSAFEVTLLPAQANAPGTPAFRDAVSAPPAVQALGGRVTLLVDARELIPEVNNMTS